MSKVQLECHPATADRWKDLERLFGERGACGGCWCMSWRLPRAEFAANKGAKNRASLRALVRSRRAPGVLAYVDSKAIGWCAIAPRAAYPALERSRILAKVDDEPVWSVSCFFVAKPFRHQGVSLALLKAAVAYARSEGARIVEGYPNDLDSPLPDTFVWTEMLPAFRQAGFKVVARRSAKRPIMRMECKPVG